MIIKNFFTEKPKEEQPEQAIVKPKGLSESNIPIIKNFIQAQASNEDKSTPIDEIMEDVNAFRIENYLLDAKWKSLLRDEFKKPYFVKINEFLETQYQKGIVRPPKELVFNAFNSTGIDKIRIVIIGQDPYHNDNQAHGLSFSVPDGIPLPPSLKNIFIELKRDIPEFERSAKNSGCLQKWTEEGVFLLNAILTVEAHKASSHSSIGWEKFTDAVIRIISEKNSGCAFLLWGNFAKKKESLIDTKKHKVIKSGHPSPLSVNLFFNSKCFSQANDFLKSIGKKPVNWSLK